MEKFKKIVFLSNISDCKIDFIKNVLKWTEFLGQNFQHNFLNFFEGNNLIEEFYCKVQ